jgi:ATP-dependent Clp protease ATP-binding subunit ClpC
LFERYTEKARRAIFFARSEASNFGSPWIEPEHLLLGLMHDNRSLLQRLSSTNLDGIRKEIEEIAPPGTTDVPTSADLPVSHPLRRALAFAAEESEKLNHRHIGTEHLLLGLLREPESIVPNLLHKYGISREAVLNGIAGQSFSQGAPGEPGRGRHTTSRKEGTAEIFETHHSFQGHEIVIIERMSLTEDGKTLSYSQEISGPGKSVRHSIDFDVS